MMHDRSALPLTCTVHAPHCGDAAAELGAGQAERVADRPQQRRVRIDVERAALPLTVSVIAIVSISSS